MRRYPASAAALSPCRLLFFPAETVLAYLQPRPARYRALVEATALRLREVTDQLEMVSLYSVESRLARYLLGRANHGGQVEAGCAVLLDIPKATLAAHLGTVPETLSRSLRRLNQQGLIRENDGHIFLTDPRRLRHVADGMSVARTNR